MNGYLLDTNVISEVRKGRRADPHVLSWFDSIGDDEDFFVSALVLGEIRKGIEQARSKDPVKARKLEQWLTGLERAYEIQILPVDAAIADLWGRLSAIRPLATVDGLLAATALSHNLTFVTRNVQDVAHTGAELLNPFESRG